ncbi:MAG: dihydrolipoamide acetyltransferase family protein [Acidobacteria bacterium]|nr:dihydrolipoamide acetyltransferase family protein [Acidobacteriota bacterium]
MPTNVLMPQLGESIAEGTIIRWNKSVGDAVDRDEPLFEISTDKVDAEIPSPVAGTLVAIRVPAGETVPVDSVVAVIGAADAEAVSPPSPVSVADDVTVTSTAPAPAPPAVGGAERQTVRLSPVVRRLASEHDVDPAAVQGTGAGGRVTKEDVLRFVESRSAAAAAGRAEPLTTMRRKIAEHMVMSRRTSAHVHTVFEVDFSHVAQLRDARKAEYAAAGAKLTYLSFVAKAVVDAIPEVPVVNATFDGDSVLYRDDIGLGIAVALDDGLIVPVVRHARDTSVLEMSRAIADLAERARTRRLAPAEVEGGTFTITNHGGFGSLLGMPIINQPQLAILGMGAVEPRPVVVDGAVVVRLRAYLTLGFDHRVIDGATADRFMAAVRRNIEHFDATQV